MQEELDTIVWSEIEHIKNSISMEGLEDINALLDDFFENEDSINQESN